MINANNSIGSRDAQVCTFLSLGNTSVFQSVADLLITADLMILSKLTSGVLVRPYGSWPKLNHHSPM